MASVDTGLTTGTSIPSDQYLGAGITLSVVAGIFVVARIASSRRQKKISIDDYLAVLALVALIASLALTYIMVGYLADATTTISQIIGLSQVTNWITPIAMWSCKVPILLLYVKLFGIKPWLRWSSYATLAVTGIIFLTGAAVVCARCDLRGGPATPEFLFNCSNAASRSGVALGTTAIVTDVVIFVLPIPVIIKLNLAPRKKFGLALMFMTGLFGLVASIISTYYKYSSLNGSSVGLTNAMICTIVECAVAIIIGCVPPTSTLWSQLVVGGGLFSRLTSAFSQRSLLRSRSARVDSSKATTNPRPSGSSTDKITGNSLATPHWGDGDSVPWSRDHTVAVPLADIERSTRH